MISTPCQLGQTPLPGRYDTESALQHVLAVEASVEMALPLVLRTLRHGIGPTACSGCRSVRRNGPSAGFCGRYDTESGLQHVLAVEASVEMALPLVFADTTTRNRAYSMFWLSKRPLKWLFRCFFRTLRHGIGPTACSGCRSVHRNGRDMLV